VVFRPPFAPRRGHPRLHLRTADASVPRRPSRSTSWAWTGTRCSDRVEFVCCPVAATANTGRWPCRGRRMSDSPRRPSSQLAVEAPHTMSFRSAVAAPSARVCHRVPMTALGAAAVARPAAVLASPMHDHAGAPTASRDLFCCVNPSSSKKLKRKATVAASSSAGAAGSAGPRPAAVGLPSPPVTGAVSNAQRAALPPLVTAARNLVEQASRKRQPGFAAAYCRHAQPFPRSASPISRLASTTPPVVRSISSFSGRGRNA